MRHALFPALALALAALRGLVELFALQAWRWRDRRAATAPADA